MKKYIRVYKKLLELNLKIILEYRANFIFGSINTISWSVLNIVQIHLLTIGVKSIYGWSRNELILLTVILNVLTGLFHLFFSRNFDRFSELVHFGLLDNVLSKPLDSQFLITLWHIRFHNLFRTIIISIYGYILMKSMNYTISINIIFIFIILLLLGLILMYSIWMLFSTLIIWFTNLTNLVDLLYFTNQLSRYPREMYLNVGNHLLLTILPFTFIAIPSTKALAGKIIAGEIGGLFIFSLSFFFVSRFFWKYALRYYTSANS